MQIDGVYTALITPFQTSPVEKDQVDYSGLRENIRFQIKSGVSGILPLGTTGETPTLSRDEQDNIISLAVEEAKGKVYIMVGTGSNSTQRTIENTARAKELGADIALIVTPYYNKPTQQGILQHFEAVMSAVDIPTVVYNIKGRCGTNIETGTMEQLAELPNIIAVKEASGDIDQIGQVIDRIQNRKKTFSVMSGDDAMTLPLMALGGRGVISVVSNLVPDKVLVMVKAAQEGDFSEARRQHFELLPLFKAAFIESNPIPIKAAMKLCGMAAGSCRLPLSELQPESEDKLKQVLRKSGLLK